MVNAHPGRKINKEELQKDAVSIVQQVFSAWDGLVDVVVILKPRGSPIGEQVSGRSIESNEEYRAALAQEARGIPLHKDLKGIRG